MNSAHESLNVLVRRFGPGVLDDAEDLRSLLGDMMPGEDQAADRHVIVEAVDDGVVGRLRDLLGTGAEPRSAVERVADLMSQHRRTDVLSARWAVATIGSTLDLVPLDLLGEVTEARNRPPTQDSMGARPGGDRRAGNQPAGSPPVGGPPVGDRPAVQPGIETIVPPPRDSNEALPPTNFPPPATPPWQSVPPPEQSQPTPPWQSQPTPPWQPPPPQRRRPIWLLVGLPAVAVLAVAAIIWAVVASGGDDDPPVTDPPPVDLYDVAEVASRFDALGDNLLAGASECVRVAPADGEDESVRCDAGDFDIVLVTFESRSALEDSRSARTDGSGWMVTSSRDGNYAEQELVTGGSAVYWDATDAVQSAYVRADQSLDELKSWWTARDVTVVTPTTPPVPDTWEGLFTDPGFEQFARFYVEGSDADCSLVEELDEGDVEAVVCEYANDFVVGFYLAASVADMTVYRDFAMLDDGAGYGTAGSVVVDTYTIGDGETTQGSVITYLDKDTGNARVYWDQDSTFAYGFISSPRTDEEEAIEFWRNGP